MSAHRRLSRARSRQLEVVSDLDISASFASPCPVSAKRKSRTDSPSLPCTPLQRLDVNTPSPRSAKRKHPQADSLPGGDGIGQQAAKREKENDGTAHVTSPMVRQARSASCRSTTSTSSSSSSPSSSSSTTTAAEASEVVAAATTTAATTSSSSMWSRSSSTRSRAPKRTASTTSRPSTAAAVLSSMTEVAKAFEKRRNRRSTSVSDFHRPRERSNSMSRRVKGMYRTMSQRAARRASKHKPTPSRQYYGSPKTCRNDLVPLSAGVPESERESVPERELSRREAVHELRHREQSFLAHVSETLNVYAEPMVNMKAITPEQRDVLFFRLTDIRDLHQELYVQLNSADENSGDRGVGHVFAEWVVKVKEVYMDYLRNQGRAKALLETLRKDNRVFLEFVETARDLSHLKRLDLTALLGLPRHKLTTYELMLKRILKYTPEESAEHEGLVSAIQACASVIGDIDRRIQIDALRELVDGNHAIGDDDELLFERKANFKDGKEVTLYVLPAIVIVTKNKRGKETLHGKPIGINNARVNDESEQHGSMCIHLQNLDHAQKRTRSFTRSGSFRLSRRGSVFSRSSFVIKFRSMEDKHAFIAAVQSAQQDSTLPRDSTKEA